MSSTAALVGIPAYLAYSAAKGGIRAMTKSIAIHCKQQKLGIRCNSVHPGSISTPMVHHALKTNERHSRDRTVRERFVVDTS